MSWPLVVGGLALATSARLAGMAVGARCTTRGIFWARAVVGALIYLLCAAMIYAGLVRP